MRRNIFKSTIFFILVLLISSPALAQQKWNVMSSPVSADLVGIWASSPDNAYAITGDGVVIHYDGLKWQVLKKLLWTDSKTNQLNDMKDRTRCIWGSDPDNVFVMGFFPRIFHYNGTDWQEKAQIICSLCAVDAAHGFQKDKLIVVGTNAKSPGSGLFAKIYDGKNWNDISLLAEIGQVKSVWAMNTNNIYLCGGTHFSADSTDTIIHYNGKRARQIFNIGFKDHKSQKALFKKKLSFESIWGSQNGNIFVVGKGGILVNIKKITPILMDSPTTLDLYSVSGVSEKEIYAVGEEGVIIRFDGLTWKNMVSPTYNKLNAVFSSPKAGVFVVGKGGIIIQLIR